MSVEPSISLNEFAEFADDLHGRRVQNERLVRQAIRRAESQVADAVTGAIDASAPGGALDATASRGSLDAIARAVDKTLGDLDRAAEELRAQNEALFAARTELEGTAALFRDLFEFAPTPYVVTTADTRILYANQAACDLLGRPRNHFAGKPLICRVPLEDRSTFRAAVLRSNLAESVTTWTATLLGTGGEPTIVCRMRIRARSNPSAPSGRVLYWTITEETDEDLF
jgi:PAS domain-containing protein